MITPQRFSFSFGDCDMLAEYGIYVRNVDILQPQLRERKQIIPERSGAYDFGAKYYDERIIKFECVSVSSLTRGQLRELAYVLSRKNSISSWKEPDKYYIGRLYDPADINYAGNTGVKFTLTFVCEPFAYGNTVDDTFTDGVYAPEYAGTAETPTRIQIENNGSATVTGVTLTITRRN